MAWTHLSKRVRTLDGDSLQADKIFSFNEKFEFKYSFFRINQWQLSIINPTQQHVTSTSSLFSLTITSRISGLYDRELGAILLNLSQSVRIITNELNERKQEVDNLTEVNNLIKRENV